MTTPALLVLADGSTFHGISVGFDGSTSGEVVFNTSMTGYQEILTDPSYCKQIVPSPTPTSAIPAPTPKTKKATAFMPQA